MKYLKNTNLSKAVSENRERKKHVVTSTELVWHWGLTKTAQEKKTADQYSSWKVTWMSLCCARLSHSVVSDSLWPHWLQPASLLCSWDSSGKNTGVGCPAFLQGIFPTQGLNPGLLDCRTILYHLSPPGKPRNTGVGSLSLLQGIFPTLESNWGLPCCSRFFTSWATREALWMSLTKYY